MKKILASKTMAVSASLAIILSMAACSSNTSKPNNSADSNKTSQTTAATGNTDKAASASKDPTPVRFFRVAVTQDPTKDRVLLELQKRTNTKLEFVTAPWDQYVTKENTMFASNDKFDIMALEDSGVNYPQLARTGKLMDLGKLLDSGKYPNLKAIATDPLYKNLLVDGKIYGIPQPVQPGGGWIAGIRSDWLKKVGLPMPKTTEDLYNVFKAFKEKDPDGNGKNDTLAMYITPFDPWNFLLSTYTEPVEFRDNNGKLEYNYTSEKYKKALQFVKRLYDDDLINKDFLTVKDKDISINQFIAGKTGIAYSPMWSKTLDATKKNDPNTDVQLLFPVPHDPNYTSGATATDAGWHWMINVLPANEKNPEKMLDFLEYLSTDEGRKLMSTGIEGVHYSSYKDGVFTGINADEQNKDWDPKNGEGPTGHPLWWGMINTINGTIDYKNNTGNLLKAFQNTTTFVSEEDKKNNPYYEQRKLITTVMAHEAVPAMLDSKAKYAGKMKSVRDEYSAKMILSKASDFDKIWDEYVDKMNKSGLDEVMKEATDWYSKNK